MGRSPPSAEHDRLDPVVRHARREAVVILVAFGVCLVWSVTSCYLSGYGAPGEAGLSTTLPSLNLSGERQSPKRLAHSAGGSK